MIRCFEDDNVIHVAGKVDPKADMDVINLELALADLSQARGRIADSRGLAACGMVVEGCVPWEEDRWSSCGICVRVRVCLQ